MRPKTEELLYLLLWSCHIVARPTYRNLTDSFERWAYRNGFRRQLSQLQRQKLLESKAGGKRSGLSERLVRLTEAGRLHALGGRDPASCWRRPWDGRWRVVLFDFPVAQGTSRDRLRKYLRLRGFGHLQNSVWISPHSLHDEKAVFANREIPVKTLLLLEARPCVDETDAQIVAAAWDFAAINRRYAKYKKVLEARPTNALGNDAANLLFRNWASQERAAWLSAVASDPLLPEQLLPRHYEGQKAWRSRVEVLNRAAEQIRTGRF